MRAFIAGVAAIIVIAFGSFYVLEAVQTSTADTYSTPNVRLSPPGEISSHE